VTKIHWDSVLRSFEIRLRCESSHDCLPFLVRVRLSESPFPARSPQSPELPPSIPRATTVMVKPGQWVELFWQQGGLRISRTVLCLDRGKAGEEVRTRGPEGGKVMRARVVAPGLVEAEL
jgi:hypothetical protein